MDDDQDLEAENEAVNSDDDTAPKKATSTKKLSAKEQRKQQRLRDANNVDPNAVDYSYGKELPESTPSALLRKPEKGRRDVLGFFVNSEGQRVNAQGEVVQGSVRGAALCTREGACFWVLDAVTG